jgi:hypothetical protein
MNKHGRFRTTLAPSATIPARGNRASDPVHPRRDGAGTISAAYTEASFPGAARKPWKAASTATIRDSRIRMPKPDCVGAPQRLVVARVAGNRPCAGAVTL